MKPINWLTVCVLVVVLAVAIQWNRLPGAVRVQSIEPGCWRYVKTGPGWPVAEYRSEQEWRGGDPPAVVLVQEPEADHAMYPHYPGSFSTYYASGLARSLNALFIAALCVAILANVMPGPRKLGRAVRRVLLFVTPRPHPTGTGA